MKALAWYTVIFNLLLVVLFILTSAGIVEAPPFSWLETVLWAVFMLPVIILGVRVIREPS
ncbi:MAG: hypothetical protein Q8Q07_02980 [Dehalococcoidales bacterium]|nr:hypothetical protein [Dehalococcoidales bacterium]MDZ4230841.1 hypothetical protein [Dehalococcoidales bacterium]